MYQDPRQTAKAHKEGEKARETAGKEADISASICVGGDKAHQVSKGWNLWSPGAGEQELGFILLAVREVTEKPGAGK